jgi:hypothetical protein
MQIHLLGKKEKESKNSKRNSHIFTWKLYVRRKPVVMILLFVLEAHLSRV